MFERVFIIAEAGANHNGRLETALLLVEKAKQAGADAIKFQDFTLPSLFEPRQYERVLGIQDPGWRREVEQLSFNPSWHREVHRKALEEGIQYFSTPFSIRAVDLLDRYVPFYKVASGDITNLPLLERIARTGKGVFLSTGASDHQEIERAVRIFRSRRSTFLCIMHCVMLYPPPDDSLHLNFIRTLQERYNLPVGFSDHTLDTDAALLAVAGGIRALEKHFTLDKGQKGGDHARSLDPEEFGRLVARVRRAERMLGKPEKEITPREAEERVYARRGIYAARDLKCGRTMTAQDIALLRPNTHLGAERVQEVLGTALVRDVPRGTPLEESMLRIRGPEKKH